MTPEFWRNKRVFVTGHTGFKGSWLCLWLHAMGAHVKGYALTPPTQPSLFEEAKVGGLVEHQIGDIRDYETLLDSVREFRPDIVFHMAAQPLVRYSYEQPLETYTTNVLGTAHLLEAVRLSGTAKAVVNITTDKCYENREWVWGYREDEPLGGHDPYSSSKACSELVTSAYRRSFLQNTSIALASARAGNVIGGGDWAKDRLIPDILGSFANKEPVLIRSPHAIRPWQHVLEPLSGYMLLAEKLWDQPKEHSEAWNFGPADEDAKPVEWIVSAMSSRWGVGSQWHIDQGDHPHEAHHLKLDISKARQRLGWSPRWSLSTALDKVIDWHKAWMGGENMRGYALRQIAEYQTGQN